MRLRISLPIALATLLVTGAAFGQTANNDPSQIKQPDTADNGRQNGNNSYNGAASSFQVNYASNFNQGPVNVRVINTGAAGGAGFGGFICVNLYQFDASQNMQSCCSCAISSNALVTLPINGIFSVPLVIKLLATYPNLNNGPATTNPVCNASAPVKTANITPTPPNSAFQFLAPGMAAWTDSTPFQSPTHFQVPFERSVFSQGEAASLSVKCGVPGVNTGTCASCPALFF